MVLMTNKLLFQAKALAPRIAASEAFNLLGTISILFLKIESTYSSKYFFVGF